MFKKIFIVFIACIWLKSSYAQSVLNEEFFQKEIPAEQVYLHLNSSLLFSGEKLLYKFYAVNAETQMLSSLSKVGWVLLVNSDKEVVFKHQLNLKQGQSYSDFFIPSDLKSGGYKILAYTSWMLNAENNYFQQDIHILNPYQKDNEGIIVKDIPVSSSGELKKEGITDLGLNSNKNLYSTREKVILNFENKTDVFANLSVSVRRIDSFNKPKLLSSTNFNNLYKAIKWETPKDLIFPEIRGVLIKGKVSSQDNLEFKSKEIIISFPGEESQVNIVSIDSKNEFSFIINNNLRTNELLLQLKDYFQNDYKIELLPTPQPDLSFLDFSKPVIQTGLKDYIIEKSTNNQIENAYAAIKSDRTFFPEPEGYFFNQELLKYNLDDYTRFSSIIETFVEVIEFGRVKKKADGSYNIMVRNKNANGEFTLPALLIVDGVVVQDHDKLISFEAERIKTIGLLRSKYFFGPAVYEGVVVVETKEGDFPQVFKEDFMEATNIITAQNTKKYYNPNYGNEDLIRIPDYRYQLLWEPSFNLAKKDKEVSFYTSDMMGDFEIIVEGFTGKGKPVSLKKVFKVAE
ncbi:hypothetical protein [uncultured Salegentibacter sp.]|uniref:hypothetical protein n=1 Tax=uncultured Salegentibacter sp. TaxID=259320 RepID=UPI0025952BF0|nr:hypothetical protein [uncultured Salegentibacter sp.]